ncbi:MULTISPECIES: SGNH/GDSL hydrolase family protein [unclassified Nocardia]|uniref:SGNH/GDSL hydrolase family protein n=1 Tax=unclassified Nocardia TaxID=2637762 RepID=UPI001CE4B51A|nr:MULTISPECIES: SGNH/GDSL hydrolase family protein [unclassified Nocardia]
MTDLIATPIDERLVRGALELERTARGVVPHRLPATARRQFDDTFLTMVEAQPTGVRLALRTRATVVELAALPTRVAFTNGLALPEGVYELVVDGELSGAASISTGIVHLIDAAGGTSVEAGAPGVVRFDGLRAGDKEIEIWLPHTEVAELIALRTDAPVAPARARDRTWLHYGSSISHGSNAERPTATWAAIAARTAGVDLINLGLRGNALLDQFVARTIRDIRADAISLAIGINLVNADAMRLRTLASAVHGFLDTVRDGHPDTPLLIVSPILCPIHEHTPGPIEPEIVDGAVLFRATGDPADPTRLTLTRVRDELSRIVTRRAGEDPNLHYLDGLELYGEADFAELPLPDRLHPDAATHQRIGKRFAAKVFAGSGPFRS